MPYTPYYPTWRDLPNQTTPLIAAALNHMDAGIAAAMTAAESGTGGAGGGYTVVPGLALNGTAATPTDDALAIQAALELVEDGETGGHLYVTGPAGATGFLDSTITISASGTTLEFDPAIQWLHGPNYRLRPWGVIPETPTANPAKPALVQDADAGDTVLYVDQIPSDWVAGIYVGIRGKRTASGSVPDSEIHHSYVTAINTTAKTITLADPLPKEYLVTWDTTWSNKKSQVTKVIQARLTGTPEIGDTVLEIEDTSIFAKNDCLQILDDVHTLDDDGTPRTGNFAHKETNVIVEIVDGTTLKLAAPLQHNYVPGEAGRVQKLDVLRDVQVRGLRLKAKAQMVDGSHAIEVRYALNTHIIDTHIEGTGEGGVSWSGHAIRLTDSLFCSAQRGRIANPSLVVAGRGYGVSFYGSTSCWVQDFAISGCRHSVLWFNGSAVCEARGVISTDARISDFDWHGADEQRNRTIGCTARGGTRRTEDSSNRSAWKWGNPSQRPGPRANQAIDCLVENYHGTAVDMLPDGADNLWQGIVRGARVGIKVAPNPQNNTITQAGFTVRDSEFYDVIAPLELQGGPNTVISDFTLDTVRFERCGPLQLVNVTRPRLTRVTVREPADSGWQIMAWGCAGIQIHDCDLSGAGKGIALTGSPDARVTGNILHDLTGAVWHDGGGNTGALFRSNEIHPGTGTYTRTGTASTSITQQAMTDGGTESIGTARTGTTYVDPEDSIGSDGSTPPGTGGGGTPGTPGVMPLIGRSGKAWNSGVARWDSGTPNSNIALANEFGNWRGRPVDGFLHFPPRQTWADIHAIPSGWAAWPGYIINSLPPQPETEGGGSNAATAAGTNNARWTAYGTALDAAGLNTNRYVIRCGWECNGYWFKWSWGDESGAQTPQNSVASYQQAIQNVSTSTKSTAPNILIDVCLNRGSKRAGVTWQQVMDPMLPYIDIISLDHYDWYPGQTSLSLWNSARGQQPGFADLRTYLAANGKKLGVPEWALINASGGAAGNGGGDNPYFIEKMHDEFAQLAADGLLAYEGYYEEAGGPPTLQHRMMTGQYPAAAGAYQSAGRWGS
ncbi:hypothetical protein [Kineosporia sp. NBRC 101731]|uniref:hypothetical protein n=1 Tax=Kineosporia sp. NBRC 101731 TaxID=3032199 RepID=UPI0024A1A65D|nr:hypothetical protein [Kineosporia sp. NBRC 101731]GLY32111.1 hypothetical protein Kisp02_54760 [Kineosporia sp. NBRC 101731]